MIFNNLKASSALIISGYSDFEEFHESERYAGAESIPLSPKTFNVLRASVAFPSCTLSLVRTFPRIINGYDFSGRRLVVVPMNHISSTRLNGDAIGQSLILIGGIANCTVVEPEGRLVAIISIHADVVAHPFLQFSDGHRLLRLMPGDLADLRTSILGILDFAAHNPEANSADVLLFMQSTMLTALNIAMSGGSLHNDPTPPLLVRQKAIVDHVNRLIGLKPIETANEQLADAIGISVRTLQKASRVTSGLSIHRYSRLNRLWSVRRQLRTGGAGMTVKASALAHGFRHLSQFTKAYEQAFGELPSTTLAFARFGLGKRRLSLPL